ncbi:MAG: TRAP transporter substrate-binding protein DctP [Clostridiales Family XIII bacterium]|jgi:TRAP-type C4-dicarboxylate transport system substrate-binding protein|nr:TRAP transporter substrate-binding protein DctP [Clostridiales Family XIII bacterium]
MKKKLLVVLAVLMASVMVLAACSSNTPAPEPAPEPDQGSAAVPEEPAPAEEAVVYDYYAGDAQSGAEAVLTLTQHDPDESLPGKYCYAWAEAVYSQSEGRIYVDVNNGGALAKPTESLDKVKNGAVDLAWGLQSFYPGQFPLTDTLSMPLVPYTDSVQASQIMESVYEAGLLAGDTGYEGTKVILIRSGNDAPIITTSKKLETAADLKGMTLRGSAAPIQSFLGEFGATGAGCPINELYQNLQNGQFNGAITDWHGVDSFSLFEVAKYYADEAITYNTYYFLINEAKYNGLSDENKAVIDSLSGTAALDIMLTSWEDMETSTKEKIAAAGGEVYTLSAEEHQKLDDAATKVKDAYVADGGDAVKALYDAILAAL